MNRAQIYYFIGNLLSADFGIEKKHSIIEQLESPDFDWSLFIRTGSNHLVLQTLFCKLRQNNLTDYLPSDIYSHLKFIYDINYQRNAQILDQVKLINQLLNNECIEPLYLKGTGNILDNLYSDLGERIMFDIDILLPEEQCLNAANILLSNGYQSLTEISESNLTKGKHLPPIYKPGTNVFVEIHKQPLGAEYSNIINTNSVWESKKLISGYGNCYVLSDRDKTVINFIHSQLAHNGHVYARVHLRNLYDLLLLSKRLDIEKCLADLNDFTSQTSGYLNLMQQAFAVNAQKTKSKKLSTRFFLIRHEFNLRSRSAGIITYFFVKLYRSYYRNLYRAVVNKDLRISLLKKISNKNWYSKHLGTFTRVYKKKDLSLAKTG